MVDYLRQVQLAAGDAARRLGYKAAAGIVGGAGAAFLLAAVWSFLAHVLGWGSALASLTIGCVLLLLAIVLLALSSRRRHEMPTGDDLTKEVHARAALVAEISKTRLILEADRVVQHTASRLDALLENTEHRARRLFQRGILGLFIGSNRARHRDGPPPQPADAGADGRVYIPPGKMAAFFMLTAVAAVVASRISTSNHRPAQHDPDDLI